MICVYGYIGLLRMFRFIGSLIDPLNLNFRSVTGGGLDIDQLLAAAVVIGRLSSLEFIQGSSALDGLPVDRDASRLRAEHLRSDRNSGSGDRDGYRAVLKVLACVYGHRGPVAVDKRIAAITLRVYPEGQIRVVVHIVTDGATQFIIFIEIQGNNAPIANVDRDGIHIAVIILCAASGGKSVVEEINPLALGQIDFLYGLPLFEDRCHKKRPAKHILLF